MTFERSGTGNPNDSSGMLERRVNQVMRMMDRYKHDPTCFEKTLYVALENNFGELKDEFKRRKDMALYQYCINWYTRHKGVEHL